MSRIGEVVKQDRLNCDLSIKTAACSLNCSNEFLISLENMFLTISPMWLYYMSELYKKHSYIDYMKIAGHIVPRTHTNAGECSHQYGDCDD